MAKDRPWIFEKPKSRRQKNYSCTPKRAALGFSCSGIPKHCVWANYGNH